MLKFKLCRHCKKRKIFSEFYRDCSKRSGRGSWCKECQLKDKLNGYYSNPIKFMIKNKNYYASNKEKLKEYNRKRSKIRHFELRTTAIKKYGGKCRCCKESEIKFLAVDHIQNNGNLHRRLVGKGGVYNWLKRHNYPKGFQILCHNCNAAKYYYGRCPHKL